jgi:predicted ester cyclase
MKGMMVVLPDAHYELKSFATDPERQNVSAYAVFHGTHTGEGGPAAPTGKSLSTDYVYTIEFDGDKIRHMTKIWNDGWALRELGWAD